MENSKFFRKLNRAIESKASGFGPSTVSLLKYGHIAKKITPDNVERLNDRLETIICAYKNDIIPKISSIFQSLEFDSKKKFPTGKSAYGNNFKIRPFCDVRRKLASDYKSQFDLDEITKQALNANVSYSNKNDFVRFHFNQSTPYIASSRFKRVESAEKKFQTKFSALDENLKEEFKDFVIELVNDPINFWVRKSEYDSKYGVQITEMMLRDLVGISYVMMNQKRADQSMEKIVNQGKNKFKINGFNIIDIEDHRDRLIQLRPGGLHLTLVDCGLPNFPVEVHFLDLKSKIYDVCGPNSHYLYAYRGKKSNENYN